MEAAFWTKYSSYVFSDFTLWIIERNGFLQSGHSALILLHSTRHVKQKKCIQASVKHLLQQRPKQIEQLIGEPDLSLSSLSELQSGEAELFGGRLWLELGRSGGGVVAAGHNSTVSDTGGNSATTAVSDIFFFFFSLFVIKVS